MRYLCVPDFERSQHYKQRTPPWIKLHQEFLGDNFAFAQLPDACKAHALLIRLLASRLDNKVPADPLWIAARIGATSPVNLPLLVASGALAFCKQDASEVLAERLQDASKTLADCKQLAIVEGEGEREERQTPPDPPQAQNVEAKTVYAKTRKASPVRARPPELTWRIEQCWEHACEARRRFYRSVNGAAGPPPTLTPAIRDAIAAAIELHDSALLGADQRDAWLAASKPYAAGVGLFLDPWMTGEHRDNDLRNGGKRYLEPERAWMPQRGKPDPVGRFAELCFDQRAARQAAAAAKEPTP